MNRSVCQASISSVMPLKVLPSITKPTHLRVAGAEMDVGEPAAAAAGAPLDGEHHQVEGVDRLHLHPCRAAPPGVVGRGEVLHHHALVAEVEHVRDERLGLGDVGRDQPGDQVLLRHESGERLEPLGAGGVDQVAAVEVEQVEEVRREVDALTHRRAGRGLLERARAALVVESEHLAVEDEVGGGKGACHGDDLGQPGSDVLQRRGWRR